MTASALRPCCWRSCRSSLIFFFVVQQGIGSLDWNFFTKMPTPPGEAGGGMANAIVGTLIFCGLGAAVRGAGWHPQRHLHRRVRRQRGSASAARFAADTLNGVPSIVIGTLRLRAGGAAREALLGAGRRIRARHHDDSARRADDRGTAAAGADVAARRRAGAGRHTRAAPSFTVVLPAALPGIITGRRARARPHRRRNRAAALHGVQQPLLVDRAHRADVVADRPGLHVRQGRRTRTGIARRGPARSCW